MKEEAGEEEERGGWGGGGRGCSSSRSAPQSSSRSSASPAPSSPSPPSASASPPAWAAAAASAADAAPVRRIRRRRDRGSCTSTWRTSFGSSGRWSTMRERRMGMRTKVDSSLLPPPLTLPPVDWIASLPLELICCNDVFFFLLFFVPCNNIVIVPLKRDKIVRIYTDMILVSNNVV